MRKRPSQGRYLVQHLTACKRPDKDKNTPRFTQNVIATYLFKCDGKNKYQPCSRTIFQVRAKIFPVKVVSGSQQRTCDGAVPRRLGGVCSAHNTTMNSKHKYHTAVSSYLPPHSLAPHYLPGAFVGRIYTRNSDHIPDSGSPACPRCELPACGPPGCFYN